MKGNLNFEQSIRAPHQEEVSYPASAEVIPLRPERKVSEQEMLLQGLARVIHTQRQAAEELEALQRHLQTAREEILHSSKDPDDRIADIYRNDAVFTEQQIEELLERMERIAADIENYERRAREITERQIAA